MEIVARWGGALWGHGFFWLLRWGDGMLHAPPLLLVAAVFRLGLPLVGVQYVEVAQGGARQDVRGAVPGMGH